VELPKYVEVETSRRCNRTCEWCPNGESAARRQQELMAWPLFTRIIGELGELDFSGFLAFHNYNEPLLSRRILAEVRYVRSAVVHAKPAIYTNGDVLTADLFNRLLEAGVSYLRVTRYPRDAVTPPTFETIRTWLQRRGLADARDWQFLEVRQGLAAVSETTGIKVEIVAPRILDNYNNRGGSVTTLPLLARRRTEPCFMTATSAVIDYRGHMKMCCCVYPEADGHDQYIVGDLSIETFTSLWNSPRMKDWRNAHARADWSLSSACSNCTQPLPETRR
jgi:hypothetical protein